MLAKNIVGIIILVLNFAGVCYLIYHLSRWGYHHFFAKENVAEAVSPNISDRDKAFVFMEKDIIPKEDDLLKDMDLSDLDNLDLDDFE